MLEPPSMPSAGWYPDPHLPGHQRWWDGRDWLERWDPPIGNEPGFDSTPAVGEWLSHSFSQALSRWKAVAVLSLVASVPGTIMFAIAASYGLNGLEIRNEELIGWSNSRIPALIVLVLIASILSAIGTVGISVLMLRTEDGETPGATFGDEARSALASLAQTVRVLPRMIGWCLILMLAFIGVSLVLMVLVVFTGGFAALLVIALIPLGIYLAIRFAFFVQALIDGPGNPFSRSAEAVTGRWWAVFGRLLLIALITGVIAGLLQSSISAASGNGLGVSFEQSTFESNADGRIVNADLAELYPVSVWSVIAGSIGAIAVAVLATAVAAAGLAALYRSRVPTQQPLQ